MMLNENDITVPKTQKEQKINNRIIISAIYKEQRLTTEEMSNHTIMKIHNLDGCIFMKYNSSVTSYRYK